MNLLDCEGKQSASRTSLHDNLCKDYLLKEKNQ